MARQSRFPIDDLSICPSSVAASILAIGMSLSVLAGCQKEGPPVMSLDQAKKLTASFDTGKATPPPKTIDDISALLNEQSGPADPVILRARARAKQNIPAGIDGSALARLYWQRGLAAEQTGQEAQRMRDLRQAHAIYRKSSTSVPAKLLWDLARAEIMLGYHATATRLRIAAIERTTRRGRLAGHKPVLARSYLALGDIATAERLIDESAALVDRIRRRRPDHKKLNSIDAQIFRSRGKLSMTIGEYRAAETWYRKASRSVEIAFRDSPESRGVRFKRALIGAEIARSLVGQGRLIEAEIQIRNVLRQTVSQVGPNAALTAVVLMKFTRVLQAQGRLAEATRMARKILRIYAHIGVPDDSWQIANIRRLLAHNFVIGRQWDKALVEFEKIRLALQSDRNLFEKKFARDLGRALALIGVDRHPEAREIAETVIAERISRLGSKHYATARARGVLAMALAAGGDTQNALKHFGEALTILMQRSRRSNDVSSRGQSKWLSLIVESYLDLLARLQREGGRTPSGGDPAIVAFLVAQSTSDQSVQRAVRQSAARAAARNPQLGDLARREQDTLKRIAALYSLLLHASSVPAQEKDPQAIAGLRRRIDRLRGARAALADEIGQRFPEYSNLVSGKSTSVETAQAALRAGEALIVTYVADRKSFIWAVPKSGKITFNSAPLGNRRIAAAVRDLRRALDPQAATLGEIPAFDIAGSHRLYKSLLGPVEAGWKDASSLLVVAHGPLGQLPFSVLVTQPGKLGPEKEPLFSNYRAVPFLAGSHAVTVLPSVSSLATLRSLPPASPSRRGFAGFGDPVFAETQIAAALPAGAATTLASRGLFTVRGRPVRLRAAPRLGEVSSAQLANLPRLPDTADEVRDIALVMNADLTRDVFTGRQASEGRVKSMTLAGYKVLAFATHGLVPGDLDGLNQPALALSSPKLVGGEDDGLLTMSEILTLKLDADWVVLSACNTASGNGAGAEAVSGLGRAFFYAGTRALLVSNWPVDTPSARALTTNIFGRQAKDASLSRADALRQSMLSLIDGPGFKDGQGNIVFSYAHPIFWAPFSLVGDGGGGKPAG